MNEWNQQELARLAILIPDSVRKLESGRLFSPFTREEVRYLMAHYPTMFDEGANVRTLQNREEAALASRYPSMFRKT